MSKKKTKKRKVIADYRRKIKLLETHKKREQSFSPEESEDKEKTISRKKRSQKKSSAVTLSSIDERKLQDNKRLIMKDLKKTVILSIVGIGVLIAIYLISPF